MSAEAYRRQCIAEREGREQLAAMFKAALITDIKPVILADPAAVIEAIERAGVAPITKRGKGNPSGGSAPLQPAAIRESVAELLESIPPEKRLESVRQAIALAALR